MAKMKWVYCPKCRHKLFAADLGSKLSIEIKCHSCKTVVAVVVSNGKILAKEQEEKE